MQRLLWGLSVLAVFSAPLGAQPQSITTVMDVPLTIGGKQRVLYIHRADARGTIIMLPGGEGDVGIGKDGSIEHDKNFVVRTREAWIGRGYAVLIPDAFRGQNMRGIRSSDDYARVIADLVKLEKPGPTFLLGTSQGAIAAVNAAAHLPKGALAGVVLTESVSRESKSGETVFDAAPEKVTAPVLIVANRDSECKVAPAEDAPRIAKALSQAAEAKVVYVEGGETVSTSCGSQSPHGYWGIEDKVVGEIAAWLDGHR